MKLSELAGEKITPDPIIAGLTSDSRAVEKNFLFAAIKGEKYDGADFIPQAEESGAAAILGTPGLRANIPIITDLEPRRRLSKMAATFFGRQPTFIAGITGTNGKTSTAQFAAQFWDLLGGSAGSIGTLGAKGKNYEAPLIHTTPEPVTLHRVLSEMAEASIKSVAMEVSSHAIAQYRADGVKFSCAAFTNITQDHLDYHDDFEDYFSAKARLFAELLPSDGAAVVNADGAGAARILEALKKRGIKPITTGVAGQDYRLLRCEPKPTGIAATIFAAGDEFEIFAPLVGGFQLENVMLAAGIVAASGAAPAEIISLIEDLCGVPGRMELVGVVENAGVFVDYAHTPDAIATALQAVRPHANGRVIAIIGAGGDRDKSKRRLMGANATKYADDIIVTDDNPRTEDPREIRQDILAGCQDASEIGDRREAIDAGVKRLRDGDILLVMGKGHETGQQVGEEKLPFNDADEIRAAVAKRIEEFGR